MSYHSTSSKGHLGAVELYEQDMSPEDAQISKSLLAIKDENEEEGSPGLERWYSG